MNSELGHMPPLVARVLPRQGAKRRAETSLYKWEPGLFNDRPFRLRRSSNPNPAAAISAADPGSGVMERLLTNPSISPLPAWKATPSTSVYGISNDSVPPFGPYEVIVRVAWPESVTVSEA